MPAVVGVAWTVFAIMTFVKYKLISLTLSSPVHFLLTPNPLKTLSLFSIGFIKYYQSRRDNQLSSTIVTMIALTLILTTVSLLPVDIFLVSATVDKHTGLKKLWADRDTIYWITLTVQIMYYGKSFLVHVVEMCVVLKKQTTMQTVFYGSIVAFSFFVIPCAYFYYSQQEDNIDLLTQTTKHARRIKAFKYSIFVSSIGVVLFLFGLFLKPTILPPHIDLEWFKNLLTESSKSFFVSPMRLLKFYIN